MLEWRGLEVRYSRAAYYEMARHGLAPFEVIEVLENGFETGRRSEGVVEKCLRRKKGLLKVVACESRDYSSGENVWVVAHIAVMRSPKRR